MVNNPFKLGEKVAPKIFCNRTKEIRRLKQAFIDSQNIVLIGPRRWGKSSLVQHSYQQVKEPILIISIDCFGIKTSQAFIERFVTETLQVSANWYQKSFDFTKKFLKSILPYLSYSFGDADELKIKLTLPKTEIDLREALDLPSRIATDKKIPVLVCIDEFQKISEWKDGDSFLELLRSVWQNHTNVCYCIYGSKRHIMSEMFTDSAKPFYRFGETIFLNKIDSKEWIPFIVKQFKDSGKEISDALAAKLVELVEAHSYYVQYLCRVCWNMTDDKVDDLILTEAYEQYLSDMKPDFEKQTDKLTAYQVNFLKAIIAGEKELTSSRVLQEYDLGSPGNIKRFETSLVEKGIIDIIDNQITFTDPYFIPLYQRIF